jgi:hypothetical protein
MDARFLDVLHDAGDDDLLAIAERVDVALDRIAQILVDQHRAVARDLHRGGDVVVELLFAVDDLHRPAAQHVAGAHQHRVADAVGDVHRLVAAAGDAVGGLLEAQLGDHGGEPLAVLGQVDRIGRSAQDRDARILQRLRELQRRLAAELHDHADQLARLLLDAQDLQHVLGGQRLEVEAVRSIVVGRDGLGVAVDHDGLEPGLGQRETGVDAAVVELDALADAVGTAAQDHDLALVGGP